MKLFDWHCDLLWRCEKEGITPDDLRLEGGIRPLGVEDARVQATAVFVAEGLADPAQSFLGQTTILKRFLAAHPDTAYLIQPGMMPISGKTGCFFTLENAGALAIGMTGTPEEVAENLFAQIRALPFVCVSLTWNGENPLGSGCKNNLPLTRAGLCFAERLVQNGILLDVSHLSDAGFWQLAERYPNCLIATHSNARAVCNHPRNLTDDQIRFLFAHGATVGLNLHAPFLTPQKDGLHNGWPWLFAHIRHLESLGGCDLIALGSDFDGGTPPADINCWEAVAKGPLSMVQFSCETALTDQILFTNAMRRFSMQMKEPLK